MGQSFHWNHIWRHSHCHSLCGADIFMQNVENNGLLFFFFILKKELEYVKMCALY